MTYVKKGERKHVALSIGRTRGDGIFPANRRDDEWVVGNITAIDMYCMDRGVLDFSCRSICTAHIAYCRCIGRRGITVTHRALSITSRGRTNQSGRGVMAKEGRWRGIRRSRRSVDEKKYQRSIISVRIFVSSERRTTSDLQPHLCRNGEGNHLWQTIIRNHKNHKNISNQSKTTDQIKRPNDGETPLITTKTTPKRAVTLLAPPETAS